MSYPEDGGRTLPAAGDSRLKSLLKAIALFIEARGRLFQIEVQEAGTHATSLAIITALLLGALFFGWLLVLPALVWLIAEQGGWAWTHVALVAGGAHLLFGFTLFLVLKARLGRLKIFEETFHQFKRDREWISGHPND